MIAICNSTWPSTADRHVCAAISAFPSGHRSFYSDAFPAPQLSQEAVEGDGDLDILSHAIKGMQYPGRVRGMGFEVSQRDCFPPKKRPKHEDLESLKSSLKDVMTRFNEVERELHESKIKQSDLSTPSDKIVPPLHLITFLRGSRVVSYVYHPRHIVWLVVKKCSIFSVIKYTLDHYLLAM